MEFYLKNVIYENINKVHETSVHISIEKLVS